MTKSRYDGPQRSPHDLSHTFKWQNTSGETIPAFGVVKLISYGTVDRLYSADKPDGEDGLYFVNGPIPIPADAYGESSLWNKPRLGLVDGPSFAEVCGPEADKWEMTADGTGWIVFTNPVSGVAALLKEGSGEGGGHEIRFVVEEDICPEYDDEDQERRIRVRWTHYTGVCGTEPPGVDYDGLITVYDTCILSYYTTEFLEAGATGRATYFYSRADGDSGCVGKWLVDSICGTPECV